MISGGDAPIDIEDMKAHIRYVPPTLRLSPAFLDTEQSTWASIVFTVRDLGSSPSSSCCRDLVPLLRYSGGYEEVHPTIEVFWRVVSSMEQEDLHALCRYITSCSRPPLLGFKDLDPPMCIHSAGRGDRLPTASTCMNLLKLPEFADEDTLRKRLLYAIRSGAGFELS